MPRPFELVTGSYTGNGSSTARSFTLGFKPTLLQIVGDSGGDMAVKSVDMSGDTYILPNGGPSSGITLTTTGFTIDSAANDINAGSQTYYYFAFV